jgi:hypothetical protein
MAILHDAYEASDGCGGVACPRTAKAGNGHDLSPRARVLWSVAQYGLLAAGVALVWLLAFWPAAGIAIMWNILIPAAPALVTLLPGLWRNICPMATLSLLPRHLGLSRRGKMPERLAAWLGLASIVALFAIVPLRHICLNTNGPATAIMLVLAAAIAGLMGFFFEWRSGWCTSLCPIHPVEKLYGRAPLLSFPNARCGQCAQCTIPCPDTTPSMTSLRTGRPVLQKAVGTVLAGSFFGFVWGWFQVPDYWGPVGIGEIAQAYLWPLGGALVSLCAYMVAGRLLTGVRGARLLLFRIFAAGAVSTYYWYRIPALAGFDPRSGLLYDLSHVLPTWFPLASQAATTAFFFWFLVIREVRGVSWQKRPPFAQTPAA